MDLQERLAGVSKTALGIAYARAVETRRDDRLFDDPYAEAFVAASPSGGAEKNLPSSFIHGIAVRTRFFDDYLQRVCAIGCRQVVLLAAGLDTRGFRLTWPEGVRLFELDFPDLLTCKETVLTHQVAQPRCTLTSVPTDLRGDWATPLIEAGFTPTAPTAWLAEGLLLYLSGDEAARLLTTVGELSAPGSQLAFDHRDPLTMDRIVARATPAMLLYTSLWKDGLGAAPTNWLAAHGWDSQAHDCDHYAASLHRPAPKPSNSVLITAVRQILSSPRPGAATATANPR